MCRTGGSSSLTDARRDSAPRLDSSSPPARLSRASSPRPPFSFGTRGCPARSSAAARPRARTARRASWAWSHGCKPLRAARRASSARSMSCSSPTR
eukprot:578958-Alexandrium_andersonii.AAC.1